MKLSKWALASEIVGAFFVAATLVFLVIQVRDNTEAVRAASYQQIVENSRDHLLLLAADKELSEIVRASYNDEWDSLDDSAKFRYFMYSRATWRNYESAFFQMHHNVLGEEEWQVYVGLMCREYNRMPQYWNTVHKDGMAPSFVEFVDSCPREQK